MGFLSPSRSVPRLRPLEPIISEKRPPLLQAPRSEQLAKHGDEDEEWGKKQQRCVKKYEQVTNSQCLDTHFVFILEISRVAPTTSLV